MSSFIASDNSELRPGEFVLVRNRADLNWKLDIISHVEENENLIFHTISGYYTECLPYEKYKHLLGTKSSFNKNYVPNIYDKVKFKYDGCTYTNGVVIGYNENAKLKYTVVVSLYTGNKSNFTGQVFTVSEVYPID